ncbi:hypothetical protein [Anatilimnocola floriformis]|uniref:hypothetical protein n=1 Tax=Anatilimnocola floriformis TaxID=2948575 RepID=UPI0020C5A9CC|nr:hypothetical protein [Anatilimnocola floriformis]
MFQQQLFSEAKREARLLQQLATIGSCDNSIAATNLDTTERISLTFDVRRFIGVTQGDEQLGRIFDELRWQGRKMLRIRGWFQGVVFQVLEDAFFLPTRAEHARTTAI